MAVEFKGWLFLIEALDKDTEELLKKYQHFDTSKYKSPKEAEDAKLKFIADLVADEKVISKKDAFAALQKAFPSVKKKADLKAALLKEEVPEHLKKFQNMLEKKEITVPMYKTLVYFDKQGVQLFELETFLQEIKESERLNNVFLQFRDKPVLSKNSVKEDGTIKVTNLGSFDEWLNFITIFHSNLNIGNKHSEYADPEYLWVNMPKNRVVKSNGIYVFKAFNYTQCSTMGKGQQWCVARWPSWYLSYRHNNKQSQFFIFDTNKSESDPARYVNPGVPLPGGKSEWVDKLNRPINGFAINGYSNLEEYLKYLEEKGISRDVFVADNLTPEEIEAKDLFDIYERSGNKGKEDIILKLLEKPEILESFLVLISTIPEDAFEKLNDSQKLLFLSGKNPEGAAGAAGYRYINSLSPNIFLSLLKTYTNRFSLQLNKFNDKLKIVIINNYQDNKIYASGIDNLDMIEFLVGKNINVTDIKDNVFEQLKDSTKLKLLILNSSPNNLKQQEIDAINNADESLILDYLKTIEKSRINISKLNKRVQYIIANNKNPDLISVDLVSDPETLDFLISKNVEVRSVEDNIFKQLKDITKLKLLMRYSNPSNLKQREIDFFNNADENLIEDYFKEKNRFYNVANLKKKIQELVVKNIPLNNVRGLSEDIYNSLSNEEKLQYLVLKNPEEIFDLLKSFSKEELLKYALDYNKGYRRVSLEKGSPNYSFEKTKFFLDNNFNVQKMTQEHYNQLTLEEKMKYLINQPSNFTNRKDEPVSFASLDEFPYDIKNAILDKFSGNNKARVHNVDVVLADHLSEDLIKLLAEKNYKINIYKASTLERLLNKYPNFKLENRTLKEMIYNSYGISWESDDDDDNNDDDDDNVNNFLKDPEFLQKIIIILDKYNKTEALNYIFDKLKDNFVETENDRDYNTQNNTLDIDNKIFKKIFDPTNKNIQKLKEIAFKYLSYIPYFIFKKLDYNEKINLLKNKRFVSDDNEKIIEFINSLPENLKNEIEDSHEEYPHDISSIKYWNYKGTTNSSRLESIFRNMSDQKKYEKILASSGQNIFTQEEYDEFEKSDNLDMLIKKLIILDNINYIINKYQFEEEYQSDDYFEEVFQEILKDYKKYLEKYKINLNIEFPKKDMYFNMLAKMSRIGFEKSIAKNYLELLKDGFDLIKNPNINLWSLMDSLNSDEIKNYKQIFEKYLTYIDNHKNVDSDEMDTILHPRTCKNIKKCIEIQKIILELIEKSNINRSRIGNIMRSGHFHIYDQRHGVADKKATKEDIEELINLDNIIARKLYNED